MNSSSCIRVRLGESYEQAWEHAEEAARFYEASVEEDHLALNALASALANRGRAESGLGRHADALATTRTAVELAREPPPAPPRNLPADVLTDFSAVRIAAGAELPQARSTAEEAVHLCATDTGARPASPAHCSTATPSPSAMPWRVPRRP
ncbi:hypothetical protein AB0N09_42380 [Streptomyces erythrochromogenes]|uniref:hypothetical protein n=1 Tax=Streptomyces erythrochromogenes TaxID=285574 RepID=UPI003428FC30